MVERNTIGYLFLSLFVMAVLYSRYTSASPMDYRQRSRFNCPTSDTCRCSYVLSDYEISCPENEAKVVVKVSPAMHVQIDCYTTDPMVYTLLPEMQTNDIPMVQFRRCPLPMGSSIQRILDRLGIQHARSLIFLSYGADLGGSLVRQHLSGLNELERLVLSGNGLSDLPEDLFEDVGNLTWLDLRSNKVHLPFNIFQNLRKLEYLELGVNNLKKIDSGVFRNQHKLKHLNLWENNIQNLTKDSFMGVSSITDLDLSSNLIEQLPANVFEHLTNLSVINLNKNNFTALPEGLFSKNKNLSRIRLMYNRIDLETLPTGFLAQLPTLEEINIRCNLHIVPENMFSDSINIRNITLAENALTVLPARLLADQRNLLDLDLNSNQLVELHDDLFSNAQSLIVLRLSNNLLSGISE